MGLLRWREKRPKDAKAFYEKSFAIWQALGQTNHPALAGNSFALAMVNIDLHDVAVAAEFLSEAATIEEQTFYRPRFLVQAQEKSFLQRLQDNQLYIDAFRFGAHHLVSLSSKQQMNATHADAPRSVILHCAELKTTNQRSESVAQYNGVMQHVKVLVWICLTVATLVLLQVTVLTELTKNKHGKFTLKLSKKKVASLLKTVTGADGKLGLRGGNNASAAHWAKDENVKGPPPDSSEGLQDQEKEG
jgi:hypothetical protein